MEGKYCYNSLLIQFRHLLEIRMEDMEDTWEAKIQQRRAWLRPELCICEKELQIAMVAVDFKM